MSPSAKEIFEEVCDLEAAERSSALERLCGGDERLRAEVQSLLQAHDSAGQFLNEPTIDLDGREVHVAMPDSAPITEGAGSVVDRYKLLEKIGEGGFGAVYMAQQSEPIRRRVALKIIKLGMDTKQVVARFEAERQALAMLDHLNIARVIDAGSTETGRPYFVMELVRGEPITQFCDHKNLPLRERLELFQQVCHAVEHAHQKGIIHRDIKPSNVLVTVADDKPLVKVIDFGIAKATNSELTQKTLFTEFRQLIGTPLYMSPEQAERSGVDVDTRTDIYSLGVLLYEMLTGRTPLDPRKLNSAALGELQRMIVEDEPSKPSVMVGSAIGDFSEIARHRGTEPTRLGTLLRGDLDWIVLKALEKDRSRRYLTATHFVDDIDRYLNDEPVEATPPSRIYQLRKFARRNRALLTGTAAVFLILITGLIATGISAAWAIRARQAAEESQLAAQKQARAAQSAATLAAASVLLPEDKARAYAQNWQADIDNMRSEQGADSIDVVRGEAQYAAWFSGWLLLNDREGEARDLIEQNYDRVRELIGIGDPTFLALCNSRLGALIPDPDQNADTFTDLMDSLEKIRGPDDAAALLPEYAAALARAGRNEKAAEAVSQYVAFHEQEGRRLSPSDQMRLDLAIDKLMQWGQDYPEPIAKLVALRQTGKATPSDASAETDEELRKDLEMLQGKWRFTGWKQGKVVERMIQQIEGTVSTAQWLDQDGKPIHGRSGRIELARSGGVKIMKIYMGGSPVPTGALIYHVKPQRFFIVSGMLTDQSELPDAELRTFYRITDEEAE